MIRLDMPEMRRTVKASALRNEIHDPPREEPRDVNTGCLCVVMSRVGSVLAVTQDVKSAAHNASPYLLPFYADKVWTGDMGQGHPLYPVYTLVRYRVYCQYGRWTSSPTGQQRHHQPFRWVT
jgi:hypothetical protein